MLRELFHVMVFAALRYSTAPQDVPTGRQFDPALAQRLAPLSRQELAELFESPYSDHGRVDLLFPDDDVDGIAEALRRVNAHAVPADVA